MATTIWSGLNAGVIRYDLTYDAYRPDAYGTEVKLNFHLHVYRKSSSNYFGYQIRWDAMWCMGVNRVSRIVKENSPNTFDFWVDSGEFSVWTSNNYVSGVRLIMTSPNNSPSGWYDTGTDVNISVPGMATHTAPSAPSNVKVPSPQHFNTAFKLTWTKGGAGSRPIYGYDIQARAYNGSAWSDWVGIALPTKGNVSEWSFAAPRELNYGNNTVSSYLGATKFQFRVRTSDGIALTSGWVSSNEMTMSKNGKVMCKDTGGTVREISRIRVKDTGGTTRSVKWVKVKDTGGTTRNIEMYY